MSRLCYILAGWCIVLGVLAARKESGPPGGDETLRVVRENLQLVSDELRAYKTRHGRYPTSDEGLSVFVEEPLEDAPQEWPICQFTAGALDDGYRLYPMPGGILGWASVPLVYENRQDLPPDAFDASPANEGQGEPWMEQVDEGVLVYSLPGRDLAARVRSARITQYATILPLFAAASILVCFGVWAGRRAAARRSTRGPSRVRVVNWVLGVGLVLFGTVFGLEPCMVIACYPGTVLRMRRDEKVAAQYAGLLEDFHRRGVIREETFRKLVQASENPDWDPERWR